MELQWQLILMHFTRPPIVIFSIPRRVRNEAGKVSDTWHRQKVRSFKEKARQKIIKISLVKRPACRLDRRF